ncbi:MAG: hypothetical protein WCY62_03130 [Clostridia bacterium]
MRSSKKIISMILIAVVAIGLCVSLVGCKEPETVTYHITNTTDMAMIMKLLKDIKVVEDYGKVEPGETITITCTLTKEDNVWKALVAAAVRGREVLDPAVYTDGGYYDVVPYQTGSSSSLNYKLVPGVAPTSVAD